MGKENLERAADIIADDGDLNQARKLIIQYIKDDPQDAEAWGLMAQVTDDPAKKKDCLQRAFDFAKDEITRGWAEDQLYKLTAPDEPEVTSELEVEEEDNADFFTRPVATTPETAYADGQVPDILSALGYPAGDQEAAQSDTDEDFPSVDLDASREPAASSSGEAFEEALTIEQEEPAAPSPAFTVEEDDEEGLDWLGKEPEETPAPLPVTPAPEIPDFLSEREGRFDDEDDDLFAILAMNEDPDPLEDDDDLFASLGITTPAAESPDEDIFGEFAPVEPMEMDDMDDLFRQVDDLLDKNPTPPTGLDDTDAFDYEDVSHVKQTVKAPPAPASDPEEMLKRAVRLGKENQKAAAGKLVAQVLEITPENPDAWAIMSQLVDDPELEAQCLHNVIDLSDQPRVREWAAQRLERVAAKKGAKGKKVKVSRGGKRRIGFFGWLLLLVLFIGLLVVGMALFAPDYLPFDLPWLTGQAAEQAAVEPTPLPAVTLTEAPTETPPPTETPAATATPVPIFGAGIALILEKGGYALASSADETAVAVAGSDLMIYRDGAVNRLHTDEYRSVAFSTDGLTLAGGTLMGNLNIYNLETLEATLTFGLEEPVLALAFEPDGNRLLAGTSTGSIVVVDVITGEKLYAISPDAGSVRDLAWAPNGEYFAAAVGTGGLSGRVILFDEATGGQIKALPLESEVTAIDFNANGTQLAYASQNGTLGLWEVLKEGENPATTTLVEPREIDADLMESFPTGWDFMIDDLQFATDGTLAVAGNDGVVTLWDTASYQVLRRLDTQASTVRSVAWTGGSEVLYTLTDATFIGWTLADVVDDPVVLDIPEAIVADTLAISQITAMQAANDPIISAAYLPAGNQIVVIDAENTLFYYDVSAAGEVNLDRLAPADDSGADYTLLNTPADLAVSIQGMTVSVRDEEETLSSFSAGFPLTAAALSSDGTIFAGGGEDKIGLWETASSTRVTSAEWESFGAFTAAAWLADSYILAAGTDTGIITLFDVESPDPTILPLIPLGADYRVDALTFAGPLTLVAAISDAGGNGYLATYSVVEARYTSLLKISDQPITEITSSADGALVATGTAAGEITLWDAALASGIGRITTDQAGDLSSLAFSPDGAFLAASYSSSDLLIWSLTE